MREFVFHLPTIGNDGEDLIPLHEELRKDLVAHFEGFTVHQAHGGWFDPKAKKVVVEPVLRYIVALDPKDTSAEAFFWDVVVSYGDKAKQKAIYTVDGDGEVEIIDLEV